MGDGEDLLEVRDRQLGDGRQVAAVRMLRKVARSSGAAAPSDALFARSEQ